MIPLIVIAGPTGVGKTSIALELAEQLGGEIVGADSRQIYRYIQIGTAKPTPEECARVPHHLIDICNPDEDYSVAEYVRDANAAIRGIFERGKLPLLVGGTGLYIHAVLYGLFEGPGRDESFRAQLQAIAKEHGSAHLHRQLCAVDPEAAGRVHPHDQMRVIRALEVYQLTGTPISIHQACATVPLARYHSCMLVLTAERQTLYARIHARVDQMIAQGLLAEVQDLLQRGYHENLNPMNSVGYKEIIEFLAGKADLPAAIERIKRNTRRYAKRQLTWLRKYQDSFWIDVAPSETVAPPTTRCLQVIAQWRKQARSAWAVSSSRFV